MILVHLQHNIGHLSGVITFNWLINTNI